jgi:hypothetical protein
MFVFASEPPALSRCVFCGGADSVGHMGVCKVAAEMLHTLTTMVSRYQPQECVHCWAAPGQPHSRYCASVAHFTLEDDPVDRP